MQSQQDSSENYQDRNNAVSPDGQFLGLEENLKNK